MPNIDLSILNQRQTPAFYADTLANRPAAGFVGRIFVSTNTFAFFRDNGTGWDLIGGPGTGTITGSGTSGQIALWDGASTITGDTGLTYNGTANSLTASQFIVTGGTSSQFLKADGSVDNNTYNTGSGVAGQVAFFSGTNAITGNNDLFWDNVNGHLGIGTNVPGTALEIDHDQNTIIQLQQTVATNDNRITFINSGVGLWRLGAFYNAGANDFGLFDVAAAAQPVTVKRTTGQVLIGTSTVGSGKLVVASASGDNGIQIVGATAPSLRIDNAESGPTLRAGLGISTATNNFIQGSVNRDFCIFNGTTSLASPILFGIYGTTNVQEAARISAARNFLIGGVTDSGEKLQVNGTTFLSSNVAIGSTGTSDISWGTAGGIKLSRTNVGPEYALSQRWTGSQAFVEIAASTQWNGGVTILPNGGGNVGINKAAPYCKLDIGGSGGNIADLAAIQFGDANSGSSRNFAWSNGGGGNTTNLIGKFVLSVGTSVNADALIGNSILTATSAENILIGTTTDAGQKLQINGTAFINGNFGFGQGTANNRIDVLIPNKVAILGTQSAINVDYTSANIGEFQTIGFSYSSSIGNTNQYWGMGFTATSFGGGSGDLFFFTNAVRRMSVKGNGVINISSIPTSATGLASGDIYSNLGVLTIVP